MRTRVLAFDGLRGVAVLLVVLFHIWLELLADHGRLSLASVLAIGWVGVDIFFVLSGFLITTILLNARGSPNYFRNFYARRTLRIFPAYFALLIVITLIVISAPGHGSSDFGFLRDNLVWLWLFLQNMVVAIAQRPYGYGLNHLWSLAIEAQFYLLWPFAVRYLSVAHLRMLAIGLILLSFASRFLIYGSGGTFWTIYFATFCRLDSIAFGALVAIFLYRREPQTIAQSYTTAGLVMGAAGFVYCCVLLSATRSFDVATGPVVFAIFFIALLAASFIAMVSLDIGRRYWSGFLEAASLRYVGTISYGLYVYHYPMLHVVKRLEPRLGLEALYGSSAGIVCVAIAYVIASLAVAATSWELFERRILRTTSDT